MIEVREKNNDPMEVMVKKYKNYFRKRCLIKQECFQDMIAYIHNTFSSCVDIISLKEEMDAISDWHITNLCMGLYTELDFTLLSIAIRTEFHIRKKALHG